MDLAVRAQKDDAVRNSSLPIIQSPPIVNHQFALQPYLDGCHRLIRFYRYARKTEVSKISGEYQIYWQYCHLGCRDRGYPISKRTCVAARLIKRGWVLIRAMSISTKNIDSLKTHVAARLIMRG